VGITPMPPRHTARIDLGRIEICWLSYAGRTRDLQMVPFDAPLPPPPSK
jgi:hypothetical protein